MKYTKPAEAKKATVLYPSQHGSHKSMLSANEEHVRFNDSGNESVICEDARGCYVTARKSLDNGLTDYNRSNTVVSREGTFNSFVATSEYKEASVELVPMNAV